METEEHSREQIEKQMKVLSKYKDKLVCVIYFQSGKKREERGELEEVTEFANLKFSECHSLPFLGTGIGIKEVRLIDSIEAKVIYLNPFVESSYDLAKCEDVRKKSGFPTLFKKWV